MAQLYHTGSPVAQPYHKGSPVAQPSHGQSCGTAISHGHCCGTAITRTVLWHSHITRTVQWHSHITRAVQWHSHITRAVLWVAAAKDSCFAFKGQSSFSVSLHSRLCPFTDKSDGYSILMGLNKENSRWVPLTVPELTGRFTTKSFSCIMSGWR